MFAQVLLADEINRASPKTHSALLEAMEEKPVTVEGDTRELPRLQAEVQAVHAAEPVLEYLLDLVAATRAGQVPPVDKRA